MTWRRITIAVCVSNVAWPIVDHNRPFPLLFKLTRKQPGKDVRAAASRQWNDYCDGATRIFCPDGSILE